MIFIDWVFLEYYLLEYEKGKFLQRTATVFNVLDAEKYGSHEYIRKLLTKFEGTGYIYNKTEVTPPVLEETANVEVLGQFARNLEHSFRKTERKQECLMRKVL